MAAAPYSSFLLLASETADGILFSVWSWKDLFIEDESQRSGDPILGPLQVVGAAVPPLDIDLEAVAKRAQPTATLIKTQHVVTRSEGTTRFGQLLQSQMGQVPA